MIQHWWCAADVGFLCWRRLQTPYSLRRHKTPTCICPALLPSSFSFACVSFFQKRIKLICFYSPSRCYRFTFPWEESDDPSNLLKTGLIRLVFTSTFLKINIGEGSSAGIHFSISHGNFVFETDFFFQRDSLKMCALRSVRRFLLLSCWQKKYNKI